MKLKNRSNSFSSDSSKKKRCKELVAKLDVEVHDDYVAGMGTFARIYGGTKKGLKEAIKWASTSVNPYGKKRFKKDYKFFAKKDMKDKSKFTKSSLPLDTLKAFSALKGDLKNAEYLLKKGFVTEDLSLLNEEYAKVKNVDLYLGYLDFEYDSICAIERITADSKKRHLKGSVKGYLPIGDVNSPNRIFVTEGFSTGLSVALALKGQGDLTLCCGGTSGLQKSAKMAMTKWPGREVIIASDAGQAGEMAARKCEKKYGCSVVIPKSLSGVTPANFDFNDLKAEAGDIEVFRQLDQYTRRMDQFKITRFDKQGPLKPINWVIEGLIVEGSFNLLIAPPGSYKTFLGIGIAGSAVSGKPFYGHKVPKKRCVVFIAGEGVRGLTARTWAWLNYHNVDPEGLNIFFSDRATNLYNDIESLINHLTSLDVKIDLIVYDTLNRNTPGVNENDTKEVSLVVSHIDKVAKIFGCASLIIHHTPLSSAKRARGSSALLGAADAEFLLEKIGLSMGKVRLSSTKMKDSPPIEPIDLVVAPVDVNIKIHGGNETISSLVLIKDSSFSKKYPRGQNQVKLFEALRVEPECEDGYRDLNRAFKKSGIKSKRKKEVVDGLIKHGLISFVDGKSGSCLINL